MRNSSIVSVLPAVDGGPQFGETNRSHTLKKCQNTLNVEESVCNLKLVLYIQPTRTVSCVYEVKSNVVSESVVWFCGEGSD